MRVGAGIGAWQNERGKLFFALFARSSATPCRLFRATATAPHASSCHDRRRGGSVGSSLPFFRRAHIHTRRAPRAILSRVSIRARYAHVRHFSFFAFTSSPLCRKSLSDSRFGVKDFSKVLHRGEASAPHPPSDCNRPPNDRSTRTHPEGENHEKPPAKCRKTGATAPRSPTAVVKAWVKEFPVKPSPLTV